MAKQAQKPEAISTPEVEAPATQPAEVKRPTPVLDAEAIAAQEVVVADLTAKLEAAKQTGNDHLIAEAKKKRKGATDKLWRLQNPGGKGGTRQHPGKGGTKVSKNPNFIGFTMPEATIAAIEEAVTKFALAGLTREVANGIVLDAALGAVTKFVKPADFAVGLKSTIDKQIEEMLKLQQSLLAG